MSKTNLCIIGLSKEFTDSICKQLGTKLEMYYANIEEIFAYDLMDMGKMEEVCGIDYLQREQKAIIRRVCSYENTLINIDYALLNNDEILKIVNDNCVIVYIALDENRFWVQQNNELISSNLISINQDVFSDRDKLARSVSDITIECEKMNEEGIVEAIFSQIIKYFS